MSELEKTYSESIAAPDNPEIDPETLRKLIEFYNGARDGSPEKKPEDDIRELASFYESFVLDTYEFYPGDIVYWKKGLKNRKMPKYDQPAIVIEKLDESVNDDSSSAGSPYFKEPLDIILGIIDGDGDFSCFYFDSRRFEKR